MSIYASAKEERQAGFINGGHGTLAQTVLEYIPLPQRCSLQV